ncbi:MAG: hypothetical protein PHO82_08225 [Mesotoga sp.]|uniref:hypothetical protein n=2 Tax=Mesotoga sp. TaxID=2053577 RepID=UPI0026185ED1|nr:hypothetical protein [Mesotoga sp.]MDD5683304.1 hypothetical protein [Mesotoga sp.]MDI9367481.1 hypothetical protein [Thermotogota bacterium]
MTTEEMSVYYFDDQCPWNQLALLQARSAARVLGLRLIEFNLAEVGSDLPVFFPFSLVHKNHMIAGPVPANFIVEIVKGFRTVAPQNETADKPSGKCDNLRPYSRESLKDACNVCTNGTGRGTEEKVNWYNRFRGEDKIFGFVSYFNKRPVAFCEVIPSSYSPYSIPKNDRTAFITCIYSSPDEPLDFRGELIDEVIAESKRRKYERIEVLSGVRSPFPNGPKRFFESIGFFCDKQLLDSVIMLSGSDEISLLTKAL